MPGLMPGLTRITTLLNALGNPQDYYPTVHVAGTNGKGSVTLIIAAVLQCAGYRVGRFISPHIHSYRERFSINGEMIETDILKKYLNQMEKQLNAISQSSFKGVTEFELLTALAFQFFKDHEVDIAIIETGLGGLYDSTNVLHPLLSIITGVDYDHQRYLGNSLEEIAFNKAGIIKPGVPVVIGDMEKAAYQVIEESAKKHGAKIYIADSCKIQRTVNPDVSGQEICVNYEDIFVNNVNFTLLGDFQLSNLATATTSLKVLKEHGYIINNEYYTQALTSLHHPGRMEVISKEPPIILDVAHNPQGASALTRSLKNLLPGKQGILVCGILDDKDSRSILQELGQSCRACVITRPESERGTNWLKAAEQWRSLYAEKTLLVEENIEVAIMAGLKLLQPGDFLLVSGSFYIMDRARSFLMSYCA